MKFLTLNEWKQLTKDEELSLFEPIFEDVESLNPVDFSLYDSLDNRKKGLSLLKDETIELIKKINIEDLELDLYKFPNKYALINSETGKIYYYMEYKSKFYSLLGRTAATQIKVWRTGIQSQNIAKDVFFNYLLKEFDTVMTDAMQSPDGERFWEHRISDALRNNLYVYFADFLPQHNNDNKQIVKRLKKIKDFEDVQDFKDTNNFNKYHARRIFITTKPFTNNN